MAALAAALCVATTLTSTSPASAQDLASDPPAKPTGVTARGEVLTVSGGGARRLMVGLTWNDPGDQSITGYQILRHDASIHEIDEYAVLVDDTGTSVARYEDAAVAAGGSYSYRVRARNAAGLSPPSGSSVLVSLPSLPPPPTGLAAAATHSAVALTWVVPSEPGVVGYQILRHDDAVHDEGEFAVLVDDSERTIGRYWDLDVQPESQYTYRVMTRNSAGLSESGPDVSATVPAAPAVTEIEVDSVPIVVPSTTDQYFVLYVSHEDGGGATLEYPVLVKRGADGTTTLSENVEALPAERYRVERYLVADPGDVDRDGIDDITELDDPSLSPVNPGVALSATGGALAISDLETFRSLTLFRRSEGTILKFTILDLDTDRPSVHFQNTSTFENHGAYVSLVTGSRNLLSAPGTFSSRILYNPELLAPDGSLGLFYFTTDPHNLQPGLLERAYTVLAASLPVVDGNLAYWLRHSDLPDIQDDLERFRQARIGFVFDSDVHPDDGYLTLNAGETFGFLRTMDPDERPNPRDVVIYETLPNELSHVAGIITTVPQTVLSHVNLRAVQDGLPNAYVRDALDDGGEIAGLIGRYVYFETRGSGYTIRAATLEEVEAHYGSDPDTTRHVLERDLSVTGIAPLSDIGFHDWDVFGVKAANVAVLGTLGFPEGTVPDGFAIPFYFYDEYMKHNGFYADIEEMLADPDFGSDYDVQEEMLDDLRDDIEDGEAPEWMVEAIVAMNTRFDAAFGEGLNRRYRSSTNNEDLPGFNGAGLYDSKSQKPKEDDEDLAKSLKEVYAGLWNFRAFVEREIRGVDHLSAAMGILVHPSYRDELVNGVAVSYDPNTDRLDQHYVNSQVGEDLVTNPDAHSLPEEVVLNRDGSLTVLATSNQVPRGQMLMSDEQYVQLRDHLRVIHNAFALLYGVQPGGPFAMEIEFKVTSDDTLAIKQARPWSFAAGYGTPLTAAFEDVPEQHNGRDPILLRVAFNRRPIYASPAIVKAHALEMEGVTRSSMHYIDPHHLWLNPGYMLRVTPSSDDDIVIRLRKFDDCSELGAICVKGWPLSNAPEVVVPGPAVSRVPGVPGVPGDLEVSPGGDGELAVIWEPPVDDGGSPVTGYLLQWKQSGEEWAAAAEASTASTFHVISGLGDGVGYEVRVGAVSEAGVGPYSAPVTAATPAVAVWSATLTVGVERSRIPASFGYSLWGIPGGELSAEWFTLDGADVRVLVLGGGEAGLFLGLGSVIGVDFTLVVGDVRLRSRDSGVSVGKARGRYWWPAPEVTWVEGEEVEVQLIPELGEAAERPPAGLVAWFRLAPDSHNGTDAFTFRTYFTEDVDLDVDGVGEHTFETVGGSVTGAQAVNGLNTIWEITVQPAGDAAVTVRLPAARDCAEAGAACTSDGRRLHNQPELTVPHEPAAADPVPPTTEPVPPTTEPVPPTTEPVPPTTEPVTEDRLIWEATVTAAPLYTDYGYSDFTGFRYGSLSEPSFTIGGVTYRVNVIEAGGWLYIGFDSEIPGEFTLEVDGVRLASSDATLTSYTYSNMYRWDGAGITWTDGATALLQLYLPAGDRA